ncbi:hypothetical protein AB1Y20_014492 [Prymnesium parvum]|uniref:Uncharacterized protein n=1 Tax=Prymnesium parvum TaxID=97485 RepID=A0AB34IGH5_PRYPA
MEREMVRPGMVSSPFHTLISPNSPSCTSSDAATRPPAATIRLRSLATEGKWSTVNDSMGVVAAAGEGRGWGRGWEGEGAEGR